MKKLEQKQSTLSFPNNTRMIYIYIHMSGMTPDDQLDYFQKLYAHERFHALIQFYAGVTSLQSIETVSILYDSMVRSFNMIV